MLIQRSSPGTKFARWENVAVKRTVTLTDLAGIPGEYSYRARLTVRHHGSSSWSRVAKINVGHDSSQNPGVPDLCNAQTITAVVSMVNRVRSASGLSSVSPNDLLNQSAQVHSKMMAGLGHLTHDLWDKQIEATGYDDRSISQNVAVGFPTPDAVVNAWMGSPSHRDNILSELWRDSGVGCVTDAYGSIWWTLNFGVSP